MDALPGVEYLDRGVIGLIGFVIITGAVVFIVSMRSAVKSNRENSDRFSKDLADTRKTFTDEMRLQREQSERALNRVVEHVDRGFETVHGRIDRLTGAST